MEPGLKFFLQYWKQLNHQNEFPVLFDETSNVLYYVIEEIGEGDLKVKNYHDSSSPAFQINRNELLTIEEYSRKLNEKSKKFQRTINETSMKFQQDFNKNSGVIPQNLIAQSNNSQININDISKKYYEAINRIAIKCKDTSNKKVIDNVDKLLALSNIYYSEGNKVELKQIYQKLQTKRQQQENAPLAKQFKRPPTPLADEIAKHKILFSVLLNPKFIQDATNGYYKNMHQLPETCPRDIAKSLAVFTDRKAKINGIRRPDGKPYKIALLSRLIKDYKVFQEIRNRRKRITVAIVCTFFFSASVIGFHFLSKNYKSDYKIENFKIDNIENYISSYEINHKPIISEWRKGKIIDLISNESFNDSTEVFQYIDYLNNKKEW